MLEELATIDESNEAFMMKVLKTPDSITAEETQAVIRKGVLKAKSILFSVELLLKIKVCNNF